MHAGDMRKPSVAGGRAQLRRTYTNGMASPTTTLNGVDAVSTHPTEMETRT